MRMENAMALQAQQAGMAAGVPAAPAAQGEAGVFALLLGQMCTLAQPGQGEDVLPFGKPRLQAQDGQQAAAQMLAQWMLGIQAPGQLALPQLPLEQGMQPAAGAVWPGPGMASALAAGGGGMAAQPLAAGLEAGAFAAQMALARPEGEAQQGLAAAWQAAWPLPAEENGGQMQFLAAVAQAKKALEDGGGQWPAALAADAALVEQLQRSADSGEFLPAGAAQPESLLARQAQAGLFGQVGAGIRQHMALGEEEFTLRIWPQELGEITVRLRQAEGKVVMSIAASNAQVARALDQGAAQLQEALRPYHAQLEQVVHAPAQYDAMAQGFAQNGGGQQQQAFGQPGQFVWQAPPGGREEGAPEEGPDGAALLTGAGLDTYI